MPLHAVMKKKGNLLKAFEMFSATNKFFAVTKCTVPEFGRFVSTIPSVVLQNIGENITYRCNRGYEIAGTTKTELISQCLKNKTWSKDPPQCVGNAIVPLVQLNVLSVYSESCWRRHIFEN